MKLSKFHKIFIMALTSFALLMLTACVSANDEQVQTEPLEVAELNYDYGNIVEGFMLTISVEEDTLPQGENFRVHVELRNLRDESVEIIHEFLFWPHIPNGIIHPEWHPISAHGDPRERTIEPNGKVANVGMWGEVMLQPWILGSSLEHGTHELSFFAHFSFLGEFVEIFSNTVVLNVQ